MEGLPALTPYEISRLRSLLAPSANGPDDPAGLAAALSTDSDYPGFHDSTHAWAVFADDPRKSATWQDRMVGILIIVFQLYTYSVFASEAVIDYQLSHVPVMIRHEVCVEASYTPDASNLECEAEFTNNNDAFVAFFMLGIFLSGDMIQAIRVLWNAPRGVPKLFAMLASLEVLSAFGAACLSVSYNLYRGEVTDAVRSVDGVNTAQVVVIAGLCALSHDTYFYRRLPLELGCCLFESYRPKPTPASGTENEDNTTSTLVAL